MDPYSVLGVDKNASQEDIRKVYKSLALKYHPDKSNGDLEQFKRINMAYQILKDSEKRKMFDDSYDIASTSQIDVNAIISKLFNLFCKVMSDEYIQNRNSQSSQSNQSDQNNKKQAPCSSVKTIQLVIDVTLEDLYNKCIKKIKVKTKLLDGSLENVVLYLSLLNYKEEYIYEGVGDEYPDNGIKKRGNVAVRLNILENKMVKLDGSICRYDLYFERYISLYEVYYGVDIKISYFGHDLKIKKDHLWKDYDEYGSYIFVGKGKGLPYYDEEQDLELRGDLYVYFKLKLPNLESRKESDLELETFLKTYFNNESSV
jgi:DnaJ-class molecular chaperone